MPPLVEGYEIASGEILAARFGRFSVTQLRLFFHMPDELPRGHVLQRLRKGPKAIDCVFK
jgi:hypothetical protein